MRKLLNKDLIPYVYLFNGISLIIATHFTPIPLLTQITGTLLCIRGNIIIIKKEYQVKKNKNYFFKF